VSVSVSVLILGSRFSKHPPDDGLLVNETGASDREQGQRLVGDAPAAIDAMHTSTIQKPHPPHGYCIQNQESFFIKVWRAQFCSDLGIE
jgi:hypothetical protein